MSIKLLFVSQLNAIFNRGLILAITATFIFCGILTAQTGRVFDDLKISGTQGGFTGTLDNSDYFGYAIDNIGDLDSDGINDIAVTAVKDDDGGTDRGAVWILLLNADGSVKSEQKISDTQGGFTGTLSNTDFFGSSVTLIGDLDGDAVNDIAVGAYMDDDGGTDRGAVWILFLNTNGTVKSYQKISNTQGGFMGVLDDSDYFGCSLTSLGDLDGDGIEDIIVGAYNDDDGGTDRGAAWVLFLNTNGTVKAYQKISDTNGGFTGVLDDTDYFGSSLEAIGDLDGDGFRDLVVGAERDDDGGTDRGAAWVLFLNPTGTVISSQKISATTGGFVGPLANSDYFGSAVATLGDYDGDGITDIIIGASNDDDGGVNRGAAWMLFLNSDGTVKSEQKFSNTQGEFTGTLDNADLFGRAITHMGDLNGDDIPEIIMSAYKDDDGGMDRGAVWLTSIPVYVTSIVTGNWNTTGTWDCNCIPDAGDFVFIDNGYEVTVTSTEVCDSVTINNTSGGTSKLDVASGTLTVSKGVFLNAVGAGGKCEFDITSTSAVAIAGNLRLLGGTAEANFTVKNTANLNVTGDIYLTNTAGKDAELRGMGDAIINANNDIIYSATTKDKTRLKLSNNATLNIKGGFDRSAAGNYGDLDCATTSLVNFNGTTPQTLSMIAYSLGTITQYWRYGEVHINNLAGVTLDADVSKVSNNHSIRDDLRIQTGQLNSGGFSIELYNGDVFEIANGTTYYTTTQDATGGMLQTTTSAIHSIGATSLVEFAALGAQNVPDPSTSEPYGNVIISGTGTKILAGNINVDGNLTINSALDADAANDYYINLAGNWTNNGTFTSQQGNVTFDGTAAQSISGGVSTFYDFTINKATDDLTLNVNTNVDHILSLTSGDVILGANTMTMGVNSLVGGSPGVSSYVQADGTGYLRRNIDNETLFEFPIGDNDEYSNFNILLNSATYGGGDYLEMQVVDAKSIYIGPGDFITRYWVLNSGNFSAIDYDVDFYYLDIDIVGTEANLIAARWDGIVWAEYDYAVTATNQLASSSGITAIPSAHLFSAGNSGALPIELLYFNVIQNDNVVEISWGTLSEINNESFTVERSVDGVDFEEIKQIQGAGSSQVKLDYLVIDEKPNQGISYYRLRQNDFDGTATYFSKLAINFSYTPDIALSVFPNPSTGSDLHISYIGNTEPVNIEIHDMQGRIVYTQLVEAMDGSTLTILEPNLTLLPGFYLVTGRSNEKVFISKLIITE